MAKKLKKLNTTQVDHVKTVIKGTLDYYIEYIFPGMYEIIKMKTGYTSDIEAKLEKINPEGDNSYHIYSIIEPNVDAFVSNSYDIDTMWRPIPIKNNEKSIRAAQDSADYLSWVESIAGRKAVEDMMRTEASLLGTSYCKYGYKDSRGNTIPYSDHVSFFELFVVPGAKDFYKSRYKIQRTIKSDNEIESMYNGILSDSDIKKYKDIRGESFIDWDFNKIYDLKFYERAISAGVADIIDSASLTPTEIFTQAISKQFMVIDGENGSNEVVEVWDGGKCHIFINGSYSASYDEYSDSPFGCFVFEAQPGTYLGRGLGHKLMPAQQEANFLYNSLRKGIRQDVFPDTMTMTGVLVDPVTQQTPVELSYKGGKNYTLNTGSSFGGEAFKKISFTDPGTIGLLRARLSEVVQEAQVVAGTSSYTLGGQGKVERVSGGVAQRNSVFLARQKPMVASIKKMKGSAFYVRLEIAQKVDKDLLIKVIESGDNMTIADLDIKEILNKTYVWIESETNKSIRRHENISLGTTILGVLSPFVNMPEAQEYMLSILKKVSNDYAYKDPDEEVKADDTNTVPAIDDNLLQQLQQQEAMVAGNDEIDNNIALSQSRYNDRVPQTNTTQIGNIGL